MKNYVFKRPNNSITIKQRLLLEKMILQAYANKPSVQTKLMNKIRGFKVIEAHNAINKLMEKKPIEV